MRLLTVLAVLLMAVSVGADPFVMSDPSPAAVSGFWQVEGDPTEYPTTIDGRVQHDLKDITPGAHTFQYRYGRAWIADDYEDPDNPPIDYTEWSYPFGVTRPEPSLPPSGLKMQRSN